MPAIKDAVIELMEANRRHTDGHTYTLPSPELYPFQWLWDSCFHAIILSHFDIDAAKKELRAAFSKPLPAGMLPHIIYWKQDNQQKNWGREMRGDIINKSWGTDGTSSITQPPIMAYAVWRIYEADGDVAFLKETYRTLKRHYHYLISQRDPDENDLIGIINPDESGEDNSPRFDAAQNLPVHHSDDESLDMRIQRIRENAECKFDAYLCMEKSFWIEDLPFNVILVDSLCSLAQIAEVLEKHDDAKMWTEYAKRIERAIKKFLCEDGICHSIDGKNGETVHVKTWALFSPLFSGLLTKDEANRLVEEYLTNEKEFWTPYPVPSTACTEPSFLPQLGFWRGPVWMAPNWFIYKGLKRYGFDGVAEVLKQKTLKLLQLSGFREQYNPISGEGVGAHQFTWGGLILDMED